MRQAPAAPASEAGENHAFSCGTHKGNTWGVLVETSRGERDARQEHVRGMIRNRADNDKAFFMRWLRCTPMTGRS